MIAADRQVTTGNGLIVGETTKIRKVGPLLIGFAGVLPLCDRWFSWLIGGMNGEMPLMQEPRDSDALRAWGMVYWGNMSLEFGPHGVSKMHGDYFAEGSGSEIALGLLHAGYDPVEAVRVASKIDSSTGSRIDFLKA